MRNQDVMWRLEERRTQPETQMLLKLLWLSLGFCCIFLDNESMFLFENEMFSF